jgi:hypothetical protein
MTVARRIRMIAVQVLPQTDLADLPGLRAAVDSPVAAARAWNATAAFPEGRELDAFVVDRRRLDLGGYLVLEMHLASEILPETRVGRPEHLRMASRLTTAERFASLQEEQSREYFQMFGRRPFGIDPGNEEPESIGRELAEVGEALLDHSDEGGFRLLGSHSPRAVLLLRKEQLDYSAATDREQPSLATCPFGE